MDESFLRSLGDSLEPTGRPRHIETHPITRDAAWAIVSYKLLDYSVLPVFYNNLKQLSDSFDIQPVVIRCSPWNDHVQHLDELRVVINGATFAWAQDHGNHEDQGQIHIVGDNRLVRVIIKEITQMPVKYAMPGVKELFSPPNEGFGWKESHRTIDPEKIRHSMLHTRDLNAHFYKPIEEWRHDWQGKLLATVNNNTYMSITTRGYEMIGEKQTMRAVDALIP